MDELGVRAFAAAQAMVGTRFRPQGCDPATGLDCVGLVWAAYAAAGRRLARPVGYPLRGWERTRIEAGLIDAGFFAVDGAHRNGDVALIAYPAGQFHLVVLGRASFVHAHAGLRRVVEAPLDGVLCSVSGWRQEQCPPRCDQAASRQVSLPLPPAGEMETHSFGSISWRLWC